MSNLTDRDKLNASSNALSAQIAGVEADVETLSNNVAMTIETINNEIQTLQQEVEEMKVNEEEYSLFADVEYTISQPGEFALWFAQCSPASYKGKVITFPIGSYALVNKPDGTIETIDICVPLDNKSMFKYNGTLAGTYRVTYHITGGNNMDGIHGNYNGVGGSCFTSLFRDNCSAISKVNYINFPADSTNIWTIFCGCRAKGKAPNVIVPSALRVSQMFNASSFDEIGDVVFENGLTQNQDTGVYGQMATFFNGCVATKIGNVIVGTCTAATQMFKSCFNLVEVGVFDVLRDCVYTDNIFEGCGKLTTIKVRSLPIANVTVDFSPCPLNADSVKYMAYSVNRGSATIKFSDATKATEGYADYISVLESKGYTIA